MTTLVQFEGVTKTYGVGAPAVVDLSFVVPDQARIALIGRSGSGKSTILNLIAGLDLPSKGSITWPGLSRPLLPTQIGVAFQGPSLIQWLSIEENVALPLQIAGTKQTSAKPMQLLADLGVDDLQQKLPEEISGGQGRRVALARAMVTNPRLLLADEPSGQLDRRTADRVLEVLLAWTKRTGAALLLATHDPEIASRLDAVWSIDHGHVVEIAK